MRSPAASTFGFSLLLIALSAATATPARAQQSSFEPTIRRALALLPRRPATIAVIDANDARPGVRENLLQLDAFIIRDQKVVYLIKQSAVLQAARRGAQFFDYMLAAIIWHEMAHIGGADERGAQKYEQDLWTTFIRDERVERIAALRYLDALQKGHMRDDVVLVAARIPVAGSSPN